MCFKDFELGSRLIVILCGFTSSTRTQEKIQPYKLFNSVSATRVADWLKRCVFDVFYCVHELGLCLSEKLRCEKLTKQNLFDVVIFYLYPVKLHA